MCLDLWSEGASLRTSWVWFYLLQRFRHLLLSEGLKTDFQIPLLAISSEMFTSDGSDLHRTTETGSVCSRTLADPSVFGPDSPSFQAFDGELEAVFSLVPLLFLLQHLLSVLKRSRQNESGGIGRYQRSSQTQSDSSAHPPPSPSSSYRRLSSSCSLGSGRPASSALSWRSRSPEASG